MDHEEPQAELERLRGEAGKLSRLIGEAKREGRDPEDLIGWHREVRARIAKLEEQLSRRTREESNPSVQVLREWAEVEAIADEYGDLVERSGVVSPFLLPEWLFGCYRHFAAATHEPQFVVARNGAGKLMGAAPLMLGIEKWRLWRQRVLRFIGTGPGHHAYYLAFPVDLDHPEAMGMLVDQVAELAADDTVVILDHVSPFADGQAMRARLIEDVERDWLMVPEVAAYYGPLGSSLEQFIALVPDGWRRNQLRHGDTKLREAFARVEYRTSASQNDTTAYMDDLLNLSARRHSAKGGRSSIANEQARGFLQEVFGKLQAEERLRLTELVCDGRVCAVIAGVVYRDTYYCYQVCLDPDFTEHSPGHHLIAETVRLCQEEGVKEFNFLTGTGQYKAQYFSRRTPPFSLIGLPPRGRARSTELLKRLLQSLRGRRG